MTTDTPRSALPVISESSIVRMKLSLLAVIAGSSATALVGGTLFVASLREFMERADKRMTRIENALGIDAWKYVPPAQAPITRATP